MLPRCRRFVAKEHVGEFCYKFHTQEQTIGDRYCDFEHYNCLGNRLPYVFVNHVSFLSPGELFIENSIALDRGKQMFPITRFNYLWLKNNKLNVPAVKTYNNNLNNDKLKLPTDSPL